MSTVTRLHPRDNGPEPLWRDALGARLRRIRQRRGKTLGATARRAGISPQYLSEVERGRKDPSSEVVAAVAGALDVTVLDVTSLVVGDLRRRGTRATAHAIHNSVTVAGCRGGAGVAEVALAA